MKMICYIKTGQVIATVTFELLVFTGTESMLR